MAKPGERFYIDARGIHADGMVTENGFIVFAGSEVRNHIAAYLAQALKDQRNACLEDGTITPDWHLSRDMEFNSLSPYIDGWIDFDQLNHVKCDKCLVEFLRVNTTIARKFAVNLDDFPVKESGYQHMTLEHKLEVLSRITGFKELTVCDDCTEHYNYFRDHFNPNPHDCCNLRK